MIAMLEKKLIEVCMQVCYYESWALNPLWALHLEHACACRMGPPCLEE